MKNFTFFIILIFSFILTILTGYETKPNSRLLQSNSTNSTTPVNLSNFTEVKPFELVQVTLQSQEVLVSLKTLSNISIVFYQNSLNVSSTITYFLSNTLPNYVSIYAMNDFTLSFKVFNNANSGSIYFLFNLTNLNQNLSLNTFTIETIYPYRLNRGTNLTFISILRQSSIPNVLMPVNSPSSSNDLSSMEISSTNFPEELTPPKVKVSQSDMSSLLAYWTFADDPNMLYLPWVPYFMNCQGYGSRILWFDLLEYNDACQFTSVEDTTVVSSIPTSGFSPTADYCNLKLNCSFAEEVNVTTNLIKWWQISDKTTLYYIPSHGVSQEDYFTNRDLKTNFFASQIDSNTDDEVPVDFSSENFVLGWYPRKVTLKLDYYQTSVTEKKLVKANVILSDFHECDELHPYYTLNVIFSGMDYLDLINAFQFGVSLYFFAFILFSLFTIAGIVIFWSFNKIISKRENPPILKFSQTVKIVIMPQIFGTLIGSSPVFGMIIIVYLCYDSGTFDNIYFAFDEGSITDPGTLTANRRGRLGIMLCIISMIILYFGSCLIISLPTREEVKNIVTNMKKKDQEETISNDTLNSDQMESSELSESSMDDSEESSQNSNNTSNKDVPKKGNFSKKKEKDEKIKKKLKSYDGNIPEDEPNDEKSNLNWNDENEDEALDKNKESDSENDDEEESELDEDYQIRTVIQRKRYHYVFITFFCGLFFIIFLEISYTPAFNQYLSLFIVGFIFIQALLVTFLQKKILQELLLISPIIGAFEIIQFVTVMASSSFESFILSYLIRMSLLIGLRTYIDPIIKNINYFLNKLNLWLSSKHLRVGKFLKRYVVMKKDENLEFYLGSTNGNLENEKLFEEDSSLEPVLTILLSYTSMVHSAFIRPFIIVLIRLFPNENQIPKLYGFKIQDLDYYLLFSFVCVFSQFIIDIFMMNSLEVLHGFKLFDYFSFCEFRYKSRKVKWVPHTFNLDKSLQVQYRSLHNLCFSTQFYLITTLIIYGICLLSIGASIVIRNNYIFVSDPAFFAFAFFFTALIGFCKIIIIFVLTYFFNIWKIPSKKENPPLQSIDQFLNTGGFKIESIMEADLFRKHFIQYNKEWIIKNLKLVIKPDHFEENDGYLLNLYNLLKNEASQEAKEKRREEMLIRKKENLAKYKEEGSPENALNANEDEIHEEVLYNNEDNILKIKRYILENVKKILQIWLYNAKECGYLKKLVSDILKKKKDGVCRGCGIDVELNVRENVPFLQLMRNFRVRLAGLPFNKDEWRKFYEKNQRFMTFCSDCDVAHMAKYKQKMLTFNTKKLQSIKNDKNLEKDYARLICKKWLFLARSQILIKNRRTNSQNLIEIKE